MVVNILIVYERKNRELESAIYLKSYLEDYDYNVDISHFYDIKYQNIFRDNTYDILFVPHLYNDGDVFRNIAKFGKCKTIINMQYEQVLSLKWETLGHHNPNGIARNYYHLCWGNETKERLYRSGVPKDKLLLTGAIQLDLMDTNKKNQYKTKLKLSKDYHLENKKKWTLFLSSFTFANIDPDRLILNEKAAGTNLSSFVDIHTSSRDAILIWFENLLSSRKDEIFIYRPHPDELSLKSVEMLADRHNNFKIISELSSKVWIEASENILSWYSTTTVESHALGKSYAILRPIELSDDFDSVLLRHASFIKNYNDLEIFFEGSDHNSIPDHYVRDYYDNIGLNYLSAEKILLFLKSFNVQEYHEIKKSLLLKYKLKSIITSVIYIISKYRKKSIILDKILSKSKFLNDWYKEINNQTYSETEYKAMYDDIFNKRNFKDL